MDRRNGGDPLAPPRPPKSLPRVHRPRAPEPIIMSAVTAAANSKANSNHSTANSSTNTTTTTTTISTTTTNRSLNNAPQLSPKPRNLSFSIPPTSNTSSNFVSSSIPPPLPPAPQIVPLTPLHTRSSSHSSTSSSGSSSHHHHITHHHHLPSSNNSSNSLAQPASTFSRRRPPAALPSLSIPSILGPSLDTTASNPTTTSATSPVTLAAPRPENERLTNEYVDTPFSRLSPVSNRQRHPQHAIEPAPAPGSTTTPTVTSGISEQSQRQLSSSVSAASNRLHSVGTNSSGSHGPAGSIHGKPIGSTATTTTLHGSSRNFNNNTIETRPNLLPLGQTTTGTPLSAGGSPTIQSATLPITKQPVSNTFSKDAPAAARLHELDIDLHPSNGDLLNSITCPQCKKCRCEECQRPRQLPSRWLCDNTCLCSAETIIDYASCLCCVKALYYHCSKDHELERESDTISCADDPCSCLPHKRTTRWGCLGALSLALPCLWCYWPMRGCVAVCAKCYAKHSRHGCRCQSPNGSSIAGIILGGVGGGVGGGGNGNNGSQDGSGSTEHHLHGSTISSSKFSAVNSTSPFGKGHQHHHHHHHHSSHHHHHHSDLTPEKRLLDSSPEY
ncbi:protein sprouty [Toxorhynchites rutilus septentrionalis]|uniref:protein sprouty n=1 Tax=Toxorhynchites rutilus septentrionalis TaxID=329112 RepID=UPI002478C2AA|nr:protein sprouty [Toxorhynchites rutilus septentrionalis]